MYFLQHHTIYARLDQYQYVYNLLKQYPNVKVNKNVYEGSVSALIVVDISENHPQIDEIIHILEKYSEDEGSTLVYCYPRYSPEEYLSADWLYVYSHFMNIRSRKYLEFYNRTCPTKITYQDGYQTDSYSHVWHRKDITLRSIGNWRNKYFASLAMDQNFLFCKEQAKRILDGHNIKGIEYLPVVKQSTGAYLEDIYCISGYSLFPNEAIVVLSDTPVTFCPVCNERIIISKQKLQLGIRKGMLNPDIDYYLTPPMISPNVDNSSHAIGAPINIISQRMYRVLKENDMTRSLAFEPLFTV